MDVATGARMEISLLDEYRNALRELDEANIYELLGIPPTLQIDVPMTEDSDWYFKFSRSAGDTREAIARLDLSGDDGSLILKAPQAHPAPKLDGAPVSVKEENRIVLLDDRKDSKLRVLRTTPVDSRRSLVTTFAYDVKGVIASGVDLYVTDPSTGGDINTEPLITVPGSIMVDQVRSHAIGDLTVAPMPHPMRRIQEALGDTTNWHSLALGIRLIDGPEKPYKRFRLEFHGTSDFSFDFPEIVELTPPLPLEGLRPEHLLKMVGSEIRALIPPQPRPNGE